MGLTSPGRFYDISFVVRAGEIVGLAGLVGAGRSELARAIFGIEPYTAGDIEFQGSPFVPRSPQDAIARGIGLLPEDRKRQGLIVSMTCRENVSLAMLKQLRRWFLVDHDRDRRLAGEYFAKLQVRAPHVDVTTASLSGGNQQKIALAKWLARRCRLLILDEPTRGVDVGAKAEIHGLIDRLATQGHGILLISSELPETLNLCTRVLVMAHGRITGELRREEADQESILRLMAGLSREDRA